MLVIIILISRFLLLVIQQADRTLRAHFKRIKLEKEQAIEKASMHQVKTEAPALEVLASLCPVAVAFS